MNFKSLPFIFAAMTIPAIASPLSVRVVGDSPVTYRCNDGTQVTATYYELSDKSLRLVKLNFKKHEITLPSVISGSGARYSDSYKNEWWVKGESATFNKDINNKEQKPVECEVVLFAPTK